MNKSMLIKQFSSIEEYVKYALQIFVHIVCNHYNIFIRLLLKDLTEILKKNEFHNTSFYVHEMINSVKISLKIMHFGTNNIDKS
jgi:hypothetical protein